MEKGGPYLTSGLKHSFRKRRRGMRRKAFRSSECAQSHPLPSGLFGWGQAPSGAQQRKDEVATAHLYPPRWQFASRDSPCLPSSLGCCLGDHVRRSQVSLVVSACWRWFPKTHLEFLLVPILSPWRLSPPFPFCLYYVPPTWFILKFLEKVLGGKQAGEAEGPAVLVPGGRQQQARTESECRG